MIPHKFSGRRLFVRRALSALAVGALVWAASGCGDDSSTGPGDDNEGAELIGSWSVTSFTADGTDGIAAGMSMTISFASSTPRSDSVAFRRGVQGTFSFSITNDQLGLCESTSDCSDSFPFEVTDGVLFTEPGTEDELAWSYSASGGSLTMSATIDGIAAVVMASRG